MAQNALLEGKPQSTTDCTQVKNIKRDEFGGGSRAAGGEVRIQQVPIFLNLSGLRFFLCMQVVAAFSLLKKNLRIEQLTGHRWVQYL